MPIKTILENFLGADGKPVIETVITDKNRVHKRDRSLRAFKLKLGMGLIEDASGKQERWVPGGSGHCRQALWQWCVTRIEPKGNGRLQTEIGQRAITLDISEKECRDAKYEVSTRVLVNA
ncbi:hypothetical protein OGM63_07905 [Plectonema radiosum NIES-515]|uniref:Transposase n=1 Tax=Plectonema radiosum NIES-515 TaxID=2986073 RepID=A0ABT3AWE9_9CYAN|nr:hypothetical protein [Plectonema radiosum]MCV3213451.1 hypothetical protein [Plectonema radiosum NIES-515]